MTGHKFVKNVLAGGAFLFGEKALKVVLKHLVERMREEGVRKRKEGCVCM